LIRVAVSGTRRMHTTIFSFLCPDPSAKNGPMNKVSSNIGQVPREGIWEKDYTEGRLSRVLDLPLDWTTILAVGVLVVVLIWGPQKIPDLARSLGSARREFDEASRGFTRPPTAGRTDVASSDPLLDVAQRLGINTQGKTRQEIQDDIVKAAQLKN